jgi:photosystem II stability/assembly factor-like uncharacterized protein
VTPTVLRTSDGGATWEIVGESAPAGVQYGVAALGAGRYVAAGPTGLGLTGDHGATWMPVDTLYAYGLFAREDMAWTSGRTGWIARRALGPHLDKVRARDP